MNHITFDSYFFIAFFEMISVCIGITVFVAVCVRYPRVGKYIWILGITVGVTYDLAQCSELVAKTQRMQQHEYRATAKKD